MALERSAESIWMDHLPKLMGPEVDALADAVDFPGVSFEYLDPIITSTITSPSSSLSPKQQLLLYAAHRNSNLLYERISALSVNPHRIRGLKECLIPSRRTLLHHAALLGIRTAISQLRLLGLAPNARDCSGDTPLMLAAWAGRPAAVAALLDAGSDPHLRNNSGQHALAIAAKRGDALSTTLLLRTSVDVNARAEEGKTALICAAAEGHLYVVGALISARADVTLRDSNGCAAIDYAAAHKHKSVTALLLCAFAAGKARGVLRPIDMPLCSSRTAAARASAGRLEAALQLAVAEWRETTAAAQSVLGRGSGAGCAWEAGAEVVCLGNEGAAVGVRGEDEEQEEKERDVCTEEIMTTVAPGATNTTANGSTLQVTGQGASRGRATPLRNDSSSSGRVGVPRRPRASDDTSATMATGVASSMRGAGDASEEKEDRRASLRSYTRMRSRTGANGSTSASTGTGSHFSTASTHPLSMTQALPIAPASSSASTAQQTHAHTEMVSASNVKRARSQGSHTSAPTTAAAQTMVTLPYKQAATSTNTATASCASLSKSPGICPPGPYVPPGNPLPASMAETVLRRTRFILCEVARMFAHVYVDSETEVKNIVRRAERWGWLDAAEGEQAKENAFCAWCCYILLHSEPTTSNTITTSTSAPFSSSSSSTSTTARGTHSTRTSASLAQSNVLESWRHVIDLSEWSAALEVGQEAALRGDGAEAGEVDLGARGENSGPGVRLWGEGEGAADQFYMWLGEREEDASEGESEDESEGGGSGQEDEDVDTDDFDLDDVDEDAEEDMRIGEWVHWLTAQRRPTDPSSTRSTVRPSSSLLPTIQPLLRARWLNAVAYRGDPLFALPLLASGVVLCGDSSGSPVNWALQQPQPEMVALLLLMRGDISAAAVGEQPLVLAAKHNCAPLAGALLAHLQTQPEEGKKNSRGSKTSPQDVLASALLTAAGEGHLFMVNLLLAFSANVNPPASACTTPLLSACKGAHSQVVRALVAAGANVNVLDKESGLTPLMTAFTTCTTDLTVPRFLLSSGADVNALSTDRASALIYACAVANDAIVDLLLTSSADVTITDRFGRDALLMASSRGRDAIVQRLLASGAHPRPDADVGVLSRSRTGHCTATDTALGGGGADRGRDRSRHAITSRGRRGSKGKGACTATSKRHPKRKVLLEPLLAAMEYRDTQAVRTAHNLIAAGAEVNCVYKGSPRALEEGMDLPSSHRLRRRSGIRLGDTPLIAAVRIGQIPLLEALIAARADVSAANAHSGCDALHVACSTRQVDAVRVLLAAGASPHKTEGCMYSPLAHVQRPEDEVALEIMRMLMAAGARDNNVLCQLVVSGQMDSVRAMLACGADVNGEKGESPLVSLLRSHHTHSAPWNQWAGQRAMVRMLITARADVDAVDHSGRSALSIALAYERHDLAALLLDAGADANSVDEEGATALVVACMHNDVQGVRLLLGLSEREADDGVGMDGDEDTESDDEVDIGAGDNDDDAGGGDDEEVDLHVIHWIEIAERNMRREPVWVRVARPHHPAAEAGVALLPHLPPGVIPPRAALLGEDGDGGAAVGRNGAIGAAVRAGDIANGINVANVANIGNVANAGDAGNARGAVNAVAGAGANAAGAGVGAGVGPNAAVAGAHAVQDGGIGEPAVGIAALPAAAQAGAVDTAAPARTQALSNVKPRVPVDVNAGEWTGRTPLHHACIYGNVTMVRLLLNAKAEVNCVDASGQAPLMVACRQGAVEASFALLRARATVMGATAEGETALSMAASRSSPLLVTLLLEAAQRECQVVVGAGL